jgi:hypothetical protein
MVNISATDPMLAFTNCPTLNTASGAEAGANSGPKSCVK